MTQSTRSVDVFSSLLLVSLKSETYSKQLEVFNRIACWFYHIWSYLSIDLHPPKNKDKNGRTHEKQFKSHDECLLFYAQTRQSMHMETFKSMMTSMLNQTYFVFIHSYTFEEFICKNRYRKCLFAPVYEQSHSSYSATCAHTHPSTVSNIERQITPVFFCLHQVCLGHRNF